MQSKIVASFRKRLKTRGYSEISITIVRGYSAGSKKADFVISDCYYVTCVEPLFNSKITGVLTEEKMDNLFRKKMKLKK